jgi:uncharacterized metal-binding protein
MKLFDPLFIFAISLIGVVGGIPYTTRVVSSILNVSKHIIAISVFIQSGILAALSSFIGSYFANKGNFSFSITTLGLSSVVPLALAIILGFLASLLVNLLDKAMFGEVRKSIPLIQKPEIKEIPLLALYGGIFEEVFARLFILSLFAYLFSPLGQTGLIISVLLSSFIFAIAHLPSVTFLINRSKAMIKRAVLLNSLVGILLGFLFIYFGLFYSIVSHGTFDIVFNLMEYKEKGNRRRQSSGK